MAEQIKKEQESSGKKGIDGLLFKVQLATSATKIDLAPENFRGLKDVEVYEAGGLFRYTYGKLSTMDEAVKIQQEVREKGYKDAFIVAYKNGQRVDVAKARNLTASR